ncbi:PA14 domain-containing protein [Haloferula sp.]|uniref:PA14 domain-containing protein n=1 Tax=Haloferula sp. TaxID=2497595 RepID=UPI00329C3867
MIRIPRFARTVLLALACSASTATAQDGGQLYETYCGACHAANGEGATGGQFPPLAGSEWIEGDPNRAIQIVLHGLQGPIDVSGKPFNLLMPPQGAMLPDDQIAAILTYVRSSWGNAEEKVSSAAVAKARASTASRTSAWTAPDLLKLYPLPKQESLLKNLTSQTYLGSFKKLPDFKNLKAENIEEEQDGIISVKQSGRETNFGMVWEADLVAPKTGNYVVRFACDDGGRIILNGEVLLEVHGTGTMSPGRTQAAGVALKKGSHPIRIEYYQLSGPAGITVSWKDPDGKMYELSDTKPDRKPRKPQNILLAPTENHTAIYRNFIEGTTPRSIGFGFPGGVNLAYSSDHLAPELIWSGKFIDAGRHWLNRGVGKQKPAGDNVVHPTSQAAMPEGTRTRGYRLDLQGNPTFLSRYKGVDIEDSYRSGSKKLIRTLKASGKGLAVPIVLVDNASNFGVKGEINSSVSPDGSTRMEVNGNAKIGIAGGVAIEVESPVLERLNSRYSIILKPGQSVTLTYLLK